MCSYRFPSWLKIRKNRETDPNSAEQEDFVPGSKGSVSVGLLGITRDILHSDIDGKDACDIPKEEPQPISVPKDPPDSLNIAERHIDFSLRWEVNSRKSLGGVFYVHALSLLMGKLYSTIIDATWYF